MTTLSGADSARLAAELQSGMRVYIQGAGGEPLALGPALAAKPSALAGVTLTSCLLPGINRFDYAALDARCRLTTFMLPPDLRPSFDAGRVSVRPLPYSQIASALLADPAPDLAIFQVTPPDAAGLCSFGPCTDFAPLVWSRAKRRLGLVNRALPRLARGPTLPFTALDIVIETDTPYITADEGDVSADQAIIAGRIAEVIPDGAALQTGIGGAPAAAVARLINHRRLLIRSGMVTEGYRTLAEAGALDQGADHVTGLALGSPDFMRWAAETLIFADARTTHGAEKLAATPRLFAINSALEVDLFGQANVEWRSGRLVSGLGGAPDFARAARRSPGGRAILALPATAAGGQISRIVPRLSAPTVSIPRDDTDLVITEHGVADLRGTSLEARAEALIAIAAPDHRAALAEAWIELRRGV
jgi:acyl-CoA hydrolase